MKSNEFKVDEGFKDVATSAMQGLGRAGQAARAANPFKGALAPLINPFRNTKKINTEKHKSLVVNSFVQQFIKDHRLYPQLTLPDFMETYWTRNNWDISKLPPSYKTSLDSAIASAEAANYSTTSLQELGSMVYDIAQRVPNANRQPEVLQPQQAQQTVEPQAQAAPTSPVTGEVDNSTSQIISKIRSMRNSPDEIDDLVDIAAMTLIKLYKVSPKNYKRIILSLFNNGGRPSASAAINTAQQTTPTVRKPAAEKPMVAGGGKLDPNNPDDANLLNAIQNAQAQGR
jgi:hypothetical protein